MTATDQTRPSTLHRLARRGPSTYAVNVKLKAIEARVMAWHRADAESRRLATIPGVGPIAAVSFALKVPDPGAFRSARHFAAWTGIPPRDLRHRAVQRIADETVRLTLDDLP